jgi:hypothetical protein
MDRHMGTENQSMGELIRRLDAILAILAQWQPSDSLRRSVEEQAVTLVRAGLRPVEVARITGRHQNNINRDVSKARREGRLPKRKSK